MIEGIDAEAKDVFSSPWEVTDMKKMSRIASCVLLEHEDEDPKDSAVLYLQLKAFPDHSWNAQELRASIRSQKDNVSQYRRDISFIQMPAYMALRIYQKVVSPTKGHHCPMFPSCSAYSVQAVRRYGILQGLIMTADRLHRCGHDVQQYPLIETPGGTRYEDPVFMNTL